MNELNKYEFEYVSNKSPFEDLLIMMESRQKLTQ